jgi:hypothetical protein
MKIEFEKFNGTFVFGISLAIAKNEYNKTKVNLIFDLGKFALAFIFGGGK